MLSYHSYKIWKLKKLRPFEVQKCGEWSYWSYWYRLLRRYSSVKDSAPKLYIPFTKFDIGFTIISFFVICTLRLLNEYIFNRTHIDYKTKPDMLGKLLQHRRMQICHDSGPEDRQIGPEKQLHSVKSMFCPYIFSSVFFVRLFWLISWLCINVAKRNALLY